MSEKILDLSPFCMRARVFLSQGRVDDALGLYGDVLSIDPDNALAHADRGTAYAMLKKFDLAQDDLNRAFDLGHKDAPTYSTMATVYFELKKLHKALEYFGKAIELDPGYSLAYYNRSNVLYELGENKAAIADLKACLQFGLDEKFRNLVERRLSLLGA